MDKKIKKIQRENRKVSRELKGLLREDQKRDPACHLGEKMMKKKKK